MIHNCIHRLKWGLGKLCVFKWSKLVIVIFTDRWLCLYYRLVCESQISLSLLAILFVACGEGGGVVSVMYLAYLYVISACEQSAGISFGRISVWLGRVMLSGIVYVHYMVQLLKHNTLVLIHWPLGKVLIISHTQAWRRILQIYKSILRPVTLLCNTSGLVLFEQTLAVFLHVVCSSGLSGDFHSVACGWHVCLIGLHVEPGTSRCGTIWWYDV